MIAMNQGPVRRFVVALGIAMAAGPGALTAQMADGLPVSALVVREEASNVSVAPAAPAVRSASRRAGFLERQLAHPRVREAHARKADAVDAMFRDRGVSEVAEVFFRVFKRERALEVWARGVGDDAFTLVKSYPVCELSGRLGAKRREGDLQVPEGFYTIDVFNPRSRYHLSMRVNYPNAVDEARGHKPSLGGDIYIHGGCATVGCVPVTDDKIEELYLIAAGAREAGQRRIPVHIFPTRLDESGLRWLRQLYGTRFVDYLFWQNLQEGYLAFERTRRLPHISHDGARYAVRVAPAPLGSPVRPDPLRARAPGWIATLASAPTRAVGRAPAAPVATTPATPPAAPPVGTPVPGPAAAPVTGVAGPSGTGLATDYDLDLTLWPLLTSVELEAETPIRP